MSVQIDFFKTDIPTIQDAVFRQRLIESVTLKKLGVKITPEMSICDAIDDINNRFNEIHGDGVSLTANTVMDKRKLNIVKQKIVDIDIEMSDSVIENFGFDENQKLIEMCQILSELIGEGEGKVIVVTEGCNDMYGYKITKNAVEECAIDFNLKPLKVKQLNNENDN